MELQGKKQLASVIRFGDDLKTHSTLSTEDRKQIQGDTETLKENWENLTEKINWKIKRCIVMIFRMPPLWIELRMKDSRLFVT